MSLTTILRRALGLDDAPTRPDPAPRRAPGERPEHELVLYKFDSCPFCRRVMRVIDDVGVQVEYRDTRQDRSWQQELVKRTGRTQVPCLFVDGRAMFESADISAWLRANYA